MMMVLVLMLYFASAFVFVSGDRGIMKLEGGLIFNATQTHERGNFLMRRTTVDFLWKAGESGYQPVWPVSDPSIHLH